MKFTDDIYIYEWTNYYDNNCNSYYIGGEVQALIDPGLTRYVPDLLESMERDGIKKSDIRYVINTHSHPDHFEGSEMFNDSDVRIALHADEIEFMKGVGGDLYHLFGLNPPQIQVELVLKNGKLELGSETFEILHIPGHSPGSIGLYWPSKRVLFCGDVVFEQNVGRTDFPGGNGELLKQSIMSLSKFDVTCLFPGHMGIVEGSENIQNNFNFIQQSVFPYI
jgi:glyoxylase-like metal-dependent hydrolase (beta-lactamase superfamily II)